MMCPKTGIGLYAYSLICTFAYFFICTFSFAAYQFSLPFYRVEFVGNKFVTILPL